MKKNDQKCKKRKQNAEKHIENGKQMKFHGG